MSLIIETHLNGITVENLLHYKSHHFSLYASAKNVKLGFNANGEYLVKTKEETHVFIDPNMAIDKYSEILKNL